MESTFIRKLTQLVEWMLVALSALIFVVVFLQVLFRYLLRQPLFWSEELPRYLLIWMCFLAAALAQKHDAHINITLCIAPLSARARQLLKILTDAVILAFLWVLIYSGSL